eukprot:TCALIF_01521-PA protein Name:"Similar to htl Fibroblast growth factor receptor homolog 1 (Drosophila melanogaster)" AED:0.23 eAED:0.23 QI:508/0/0.5/1/0/1/2/0/515
MNNWLSTSNSAMILMVVMVVVLAQNGSGKDLDTPPQSSPPPRSASLVSMVTPEDIDSVAVEQPQPQAPFWTNTKRMQKQIYAVHIDSAADGYPTPKIEWFKNGQPLRDIIRPNVVPFKVKDSEWQMKIRQFRISDVGFYTCVVWNDLGQIQHSYRVEAVQAVHNIALLTHISPNQTVMVKTPATLSCHFISDVGHSMYWYRPAFQITDMSKFDTTDERNFVQLLASDNVDLQQNELHIKHAEPSDAGYYFCIAHTNQGVSHGSVHLTVLTPDEAVFERPKNLTVTEGATAAFSCQSHVSLNADTSWWFRIDEEHEMKKLAQSTEVLRLKNVTKEDTGEYVCVVSFSNDDQLRSPAYLHVKDETLMEATVSHQDFNRLSVVTGSILVFAVLLMLILALMYKRYRRERVRKQQAIEHARSITQWTKKVIIERQAAHFDPDAPIMSPIIRIEKQSSVVKMNTANRSRLGSENTTLTTVSEYELPLDKEWEFDRKHLQLGPTLGEGMFGKVIWHHSHAA